MITIRMARGFFLNEKKKERKEMKKSKSVYFYQRFKMAQPLVVDSSGK